MKLSFRSDLIQACILFSLGEKVNKLVGVSLKATPCISPGVNPYGRM
jgi:hypothetical protein